MLQSGSAWPCPTGLWTSNYTPLAYCVTERVSMALSYLPIDLQLQPSNVLCYRGDQHGLVLPAYRPTTTTSQCAMLQSGSAWPCPTVLPGPGRGGPSYPPAGPLAFPLASQIWTVFDRSEQVLAVQNQQIPAPAYTLGSGLVPRLGAPEMCAVTRRGVIPAASGGETLALTADICNAQQFLLYINRFLKTYPNYNFQLSF